MVNETYQIEAKDFRAAGDASISIKRILKKKNFNPDFIKRVSAACYEAEINIVIHSYGGVVKMLADETCVFLEFIDDGPGIEDIHYAMQEGVSTADEEARNNGFGAGLGLSNIKRLSDAMILDSNKDGTHLKIWFYTNMK